MAEGHAKAGGDALIPAATILLLRDGTEGLEVFMVVRHHQIDFASGALVFPGGKVEAGESPEAALIRELAEEIGVETHASCLAPLTFASHAYADFHLLMPLFAIRRWQGTPTPKEGQTLAWVRPRDLRDYPMPPADIPLIPVLRDWL